MNENHFLTGAELSVSQIFSLLDLAQKLKTERQQGILRKDLQGKTIALLFEKPSLRTHLSFMVAMQELGGQAVESFSLNRKKEAPQDVGRVLQGYFHGVVLRTHEHQILEEMASWTQIPVINGLSDTHHPCQILADLLTLQEKWGELRGRTLSYIGDGNNILHSLLLLAPICGIHLRYCSPQNFQPNALVLKMAQKQITNMASTERGSIMRCSTPKEAVENGNAIYTDVWTSMGFEKGEKEEKDRLVAFSGYQVNQKLYQFAAQDALIMHCLPMVRGQEMSEEMAEHKNAVLFLQSENRLHIQKAILLLLLNRFYETQ